MSMNPLNLSQEVLSFLDERHLASLTLLRPDGSPHVTAVGFTWDHDSQLVRVITWAGSMKSRILEQTPNSRAVVCQIDGGRWLSLEESPLSLPTRQGAEQELNVTPTVTACPKTARTALSSKFQLTGSSDTPNRTTECRENFHTTLFAALVAQDIGQRAGMNNGQTLG